jgi:hypothetical protein
MEERLKEQIKDRFWFDEYAKSEAAKAYNQGVSEAMDLIKGINYSRMSHSRLKEVVVEKLTKPTE